MSTLTDCRQWLRATCLPFGALVLVLAVLGALTTVLNVNTWAVAAVLALPLLAVESWLWYVVHRELSTTGYRPARARAIVSVAELIAGLVLMTVGVVWPNLDWLGFAGLGLTLISIGGLLSTVRRSRFLEHRRGPLVLGTAFFVTAIALVMFSAGWLLLIALILGAGLTVLGTELYTEDTLRSSLDDNSWATFFLGAGLLAMSVGLLVAGGASVLGAGAVAAVTLILVWMVSSERATLLLVLFLVFVLLWARVPRDVDHDLTLAPAGDDPYFLVLGDSYISGEGAQEYYRGTNTTESNDDHTNECRRAPTAWPVRLAKAHPDDVPSRVLFLPCSGALGENIRAAPVLSPKTGKQLGPAELIEYQTQRAKRHLTRDPAFVLLSVGGNNAEFANLGESCVGPGDCAEVGDLFLDILRGVEPKLDETYRDVRRVVGDSVPVVVVPYPDPLTEKNDCSQIPISGIDRRFVIRFVEQLNRVLESAARRAGFLYLDAVKTALCGGPDRIGVNSVLLNPKAGTVWESLDPVTWTHNSLHPNEQGHEAIYRAAAAWFERDGGLPLAAPVVAEPQVVPKMASLLDYGTTRLCDPLGKWSCDISHRGWLYDQTLRLMRSVFLTLTLAAVGAWMVVMRPITWATRNRVSTAGTFLALLHRLGLKRG